MDKEFVRRLVEEVRASGPVLLADSCRGRYIPRHVCQLLGVDACQDPDGEWYWEEWEEVLSQVNELLEGEGLLMDHSPEGDVFVAPLEWWGVEEDL